MAVVELSPRLKSFSETFYNFNTAKSKKESVIRDLTRSSNGLDDLVGDLSRAGNDSQCSQSKSYIVLVKDGNILTDYEMNELIRLADEQLMLTGIMIQRKGMYKKIKM